MASRRSIAVFTLPLGLCLFCTACSEATKYRVLSFFFDGVPKPGEKDSQGVPTTGTAADDDPNLLAVPVAARAMHSVHAPYRDNRCAACHSRATGRLSTALERGLCVSCHRDLPRSKRYLHGPVAVDACVQCHHHHASPRPHLLLDEVPALCARCHERANLTTGPHHETMDDQPCTACHDPHGGGDRFFLRPHER